jgi:dihydrofolate reductase
MFGKKKTTPQIDQEQLELIKKAQNRISQKKRLYAHFVLFLIGAVFLLALNLIFKFGEDQFYLGLNWSVIAVLIWFFFLAYHFISVFLVNKFINKDWEEKQLAKLVEKQKQAIERLKTTNDIKIPSQKEIKQIETASKKIDTVSNLTMIVAAGEKNEIGKNNDLIWHLKDDLKRFKSLTSGHHIIMGRKTFESFPKPLPNRTHIVITRQNNYIVPQGVIVVNSLEDAFKFIKNDNQPFIIGGGEIYKQALPFAEKIELTRVHETFDADTFFPVIDANNWREIKNVFHTTDDEHEHEFSFLTFERI